MSNENNPSDIVGKKVFFLYPTAAVQNKLIEELVQMEYEAYIAKDHAALRRLLKQYPDSIIFIDINEQMSDKEWDAWIQGLVSAPETKDVIIGILTSNDKGELRQKYAGAAYLKGGYNVFKSDIDGAIKHLIAVLNTAGAKGRRKYLRVTTENETMTTVNMPINGSFISGKITDISVVGFSCTFENDPDILKNTLVNNIQVKLQIMLLNVEGIVFGSRMDGNSRIYVVLFTKRIDPVVRTKIRKYIQQNLQSRMDSELKFA
ncbi:MAG: pilus assembly protein PilZ [Treponema sp.]|jgi:hypothetical protein|nr:pilus assembly protein PilZ [Treponema sp.]